MAGSTRDIVDALAASPNPLARLAARAFDLTAEHHRRLRPFSPEELAPRWFDLLLAGDGPGFAASFSQMTTHMRRLQRSGALAELADRLDAGLAAALVEEARR
jgi:hypothetical protein